MTRARNIWPVRLVIACLLAFASTTAIAQEERGLIGVRHVSLVDETREIKASSGFAGSGSRRIDVAIWYPAASAENVPAGNAPAENPAPDVNVPLPLVIYSHGSYGRADNAMHLVNHLVQAGYIVAAPDYPLSSRAAYTQVTAADPSDLRNQTGDISFIIDSLLADEELGSLIDASQIATIGHSLGAVTSYFSSYGSGVLDARIKATVLLGAGDPVQAALSAYMGMDGVWHARSGIPALFVSAQYDPFALMTGGPYAAYSRLSAPRYEAMIEGGVHIWFSDADAQPDDGSNPDCAMLAGLFPPGTVLTGCEPDPVLTTPLRQQEITRIATLDFLQAYLRGDTVRLAALRNIGETIPEVTLRFED